MSSRIFLFLAVLLTGGCQAGQDATQACLVRAMQQTGLQHGVAIYARDDGTVSQTYSDLAGWWRLQRKHSYRAASLTKLMIAHEANTLARQERLNLGAPVSEYLFPKQLVSSDLDQVMVRHLLEHTSGIGLPSGEDPVWGWNNANEYGADCIRAAHAIWTLPTIAPPGRHMAYANINYCLMGIIVDDLAGFDLATHKPDLAEALHQPLGGAGGWTGPLPLMLVRLQETLPIQTPPVRPGDTLPDGSWYSTHGWRYWPEPTSGARWTHTGRLPGFLAIALSDGRGRVLLAHFDGNPDDYQQTAQSFNKMAWPCLTNTTAHQ